MPAKHPKRPRDPNQLGKLIVDLATGERTEKKPALPTPGQAFARSGGLKGGTARAKALTPGCGHPNPLAIRPADCPQGRSGDRGGKPNANRHGEMVQRSEKFWLHPLGQLTNAQR
jgi:hypothetical protein